MEEIISNLLVADNAVLQTATQDLKDALRKEDAAQQLCSVITDSQSPQIRQYAAVILRQRLAKERNWEKLDPQTKSRIKECLLSAFVNEPLEFVKRSIGQVIGTLMKHGNGWHEVLEFIERSCQSTNLEQKCIGIFLLSILTEMSLEIFRLYGSGLTNLLVVLLNGVQDNASKIACYAFDTMKNLVPQAVKDRNLRGMYHALLPRLLQALQFHSKDKDEVRACILSDLLVDLVDLGVLNTPPQIKLTLNICVELVAKPNLADVMRCNAFAVIESFVKNMKKGVLRANLLEPILNITFQVMRSPSPEDDCSEDNETDTPVASAARIIDTLALGLPPERLMPFLFPMIQSGLEGSDPYGKKASYMAMAVISEGCADYITQRYLTTFMDVVCEGLRDDDKVVKNAAFFTLGQFSEYLQPEISKDTGKVMPVFFDYLAQLRTTLQMGKKEPQNFKRVFYALETFIENSEKETFIPYLPNLMEQLMSLFKCSSSTVLKQLILSALGACATAAENDIYPFFSSLVECLSVYLKDNCSNESGLRASAVDALVALARAVTPEHFKPLAQDTIQLGIDLLKDQTDPELRGCAYYLFGAMSFVLKEELEKFISPVMDYVLESIESSEGFSTQYKGDDVAGFPLYSDEEESCDEDLENSSDEDEDDDDEDDDVTGFTVENSYTNEKVAACIAVKEFVLNTGHTFNPFLPRTFEAVFKLIDFPQDDVQKAALDAVSHICIAFSKIDTDDGRSALAKALALFIPKCSIKIHTEMEKEIVAQALEALTRMLKCIKSPMVAENSHREAILSCINDIFNRETQCQDREDDGSCEEEVSEQDELLIEYAGDAFPQFGRALTPDEFYPYFIGFLPFLTARMSNQNSTAQKSFAMGILAECMEPLGNGVMPFANVLLPHFINLSKDDSHDVRNNTIFGLGEMLYHGGSSFHMHFVEYLGLLHARYEVENHPRVLDNICGAVARMILANISCVPVESVFPVFVHHLPLKKDFKENNMVYKCLAYLYGMGHHVIIDHLDSVLLSSLTVIHHRQGEEEPLKIAEDLFLFAKRDFPAIVDGVRPRVSADVLPTFERLLAIQ